MIKISGKELIKLLKYYPSISLQKSEKELSLEEIEQFLKKHTFTFYDDGAVGIRGKNDAGMFWLKVIKSNKKEIVS